MRLSQVRDILNAELICGEELLDKEIGYAFASDLMSDVLAYVNGHTLLLTGLINQQVIRTVEMADVNAIVFVRGKRPDSLIINLAVQNKMVLMCTKETMYTASGRLYSRGLIGITIE